MVLTGLLSSPDKLAGDFVALELALAAADKWNCDEARNYVTNKLPLCDEWSAVQQLRLAITYRHSEWLVEAVRELVGRKPSSFAYEDRVTLGHSVLLQLDIVRDAVEAHRRQLICSPLPFSLSPHCFKPHFQCETVFSQMWAEAGPRLLFDPVHAVRGPQVLSEFEPLLSELTELCAPCQTSSISRLKTLGAFDRQDVIILEHLANFRI